MKHTYVDNENFKNINIINIETINNINCTLGT